MSSALLGLRKTSRRQQLLSTDITVPQPSQPHQTCISQFPPNVLMVHEIFNFYSNCKGNVYLISKIIVYSIV